MTTYHYASFSGGKDSTAMTLRLLEEKWPLDEVIFCDTGMEYPEIYESISKVKELIDNQGIKFTTVKGERTYEYFMFDIPVQSKSKKAKLPPHNGYGWPGIFSRWCTSQIKTEIINKYIKQVASEHDGAKAYIGIAYDERERAERENNKANIFPLVQWKMTEADCLKYCYDHGIDFGGIYKNQKRASCWCCPFQSLDSLRNLYHTHPELWTKLEDMDERVVRDIHPQFKFKSDRVANYRKRFEREDLAIKEQTTLEASQWE